MAAAAAKRGGAGGQGNTGNTGNAGPGNGGSTVCGGLKECNGQCKDVSIDPNNCGDCGVVCGEGEVCNAGMCAVNCSGGTKACNGACINTQNDNDNCGDCGHACEDGQVCSAGICSLECFGGTEKCGDKCVDTQNDPDHCGECGDPCEDGEVCSGGECGLSCGGGTTECNGLCVDTDSNPNHCGDCDSPCADGEVCSAGQCGLMCVGGTTLCNGLCVDTDTNPLNCGSCNNPCPNGEVCSDGSCGLACGGGLEACNGMCVDTDTNPAHCGTCNNPCANGLVCSGGSCSGNCGGGLTKCNGVCVDTKTDNGNCGSCGNPCSGGASCVNGTCVQCDSSTTDCDGDGWMATEGDCCDKPGLCGAEPAKVNPGAIEVVGNGIDDNCNNKTDLFDTEDTVSCDAGLASDSSDAVAYAKALGICRLTTESPANKKDKTWGLISATIERADGTPLGDVNARSIRAGFGNVNPATTDGSSIVVLSSGIAADATQTNPGPNGGPAGGNVSTTHSPSSSVDIQSCASTDCIDDWFGTANPPLKGANQLPAAPACGAPSSENTANDSVMLKLRLRVPTNAKAFSFNSYFFSAEYPEYVCTQFNDQFIALVDTPAGTPSPIPNPVDKNLMTYTQGNQKWPIGINVAGGTDLFSICENQAANASCWDSSVSAMSCALGADQLTGTGFEKTGECLIGGGTFWLTTAGNVIPGDIVELRIAIWDVGDSAFDSTALLDGFQWLPNATLPGTGN